MKILIVDDSELLRDRLIELLTNISETEMFIEAENSIEAKKLVKELNPDIIITDIRMPGGSGIEFVRHLKQSSNSASIIVLTNYPYSQYKEAALEAGADYFFDKTNEFEKVHKVVLQLHESY